MEPLQQQQGLAAAEDDSSSSPQQEARKSDASSASATTAAASSCCCCFVCHKTVGDKYDNNSNDSVSTIIAKLLKCSRCKADDYRVCSKTCQAADWKRHKRHDCYIYDALLVQALATQTTCPLCHHAFTVKQICQGNQIQTWSSTCAHWVHVDCYKNAWLKLQKQRNKTIHLQCPLCTDDDGSSNNNNNNNNNNRRNPILRRLVPANVVVGRTFPNTNTTNIAACYKHS